MLEALIEYAERESLGDADFHEASVRWLVPLDAAGNLVGGPIELMDNPDAKSPNRERSPVRLLNKRNSPLRRARVPSSFATRWSVRSTIPIRRSPNEPDGAKVPIPISSSCLK